jgi:hypothetical protein
MKIEKGALLSVTNDDIINGEFIFPKDVISIGKIAFFMDGRH